LEYHKFIEKIEWNLVLSIFFEIIAENISFHNNPHAPAEVESPQRFFPRGLAATDGFRFFYWEGAQNKMSILTNLSNRNSCFSNSD
jgi:hypothetical protein